MGRASEVESEKVDWTLRSLLVQLVTVGTQDGVALGGYIPLSVGGAYITDIIIIILKTVKENRETH